MKKLISLTLALLLVFSLATVASATESVGTPENNYNGKLDADPKLTKVYTATNGTAPGQTFTFSFEAVSYTDNEGNEGDVSTCPAIDKKTISMDGAGTGTVTVDLDAENLPLGVYTYRIDEVVPETPTAGVDYTTTPLYMVLTVLRDEESAKHFVAALHYETVSGTKTNAQFTNTYDAGSLTVTKYIAGNMADMTKKFNFTVTLNPASGTAFAKDDANARITSTNTNASIVYNDDGTVTVTAALGNGESLPLANIPDGTTYTVSEDADGYTSQVATSEGANGTIAGGETETVTYTNTLSSGVDTGITLDSIPFILILAVCAGAVVLFVVKRRRSVDF